MTRRYADAIEVTVRPTAVGADPDAFTWQGRRYAVRGVQERWAQRRSWWRDSEQDPSQVALEQRVWRVEAVRGTQTGVFELALDGPATGGQWTLLRAED